MQYSATDHLHEHQFTLSGPFTFADNQIFKQLLQNVVDEPPKSLVLDFADVDFIDSAGLGMLLLLRDECQQRQIPVYIHSAQGQVKKIFTLSKFDRLFTMR